jgi:hypothetical protein
MLALNHRISHDVDLVIRDPQWLGYMSPRWNDRVAAFALAHEEAADYLTLKHAQGDITFLVRGSLLGLPDDSAADTAFVLEPVAEVLAKKLFYRGASLTPRDLFDWWAVETLRPGVVPHAGMGQLLAGKHQGISSALHLLSCSSSAEQIWEAILAPEKPSIREVASWGDEMLARYGALARQTRLAVRPVSDQSSPAYPPPPHSPPHPGP